MAYENVYVAHVAYGAKDVQTLRAFVDAESYDGPSLIIAYSPCIAHGYDMAFNHQQQQLAVDSGHWPLFRYDPRAPQKVKIHYAWTRKPRPFPCVSSLNTNTVQHVMALTP